jgi:hypothetical protein
LLDALLLLEEAEVLGAPPVPLLDEVEVLGAAPVPLLDEVDDPLAELPGAVLVLLQEAERSTNMKSERVCTLRMGATLHHLHAEAWIECDVPGNSRCRYRGYLTRFADRSGARDRVHGAIGGGREGAHGPPVGLPCVDLPCVGPTVGLGRRHDAVVIVA